MRRVLKISLTVLNCLIIIFSLVFIFIEGRLLFSADWYIYENTFFALIRYFSRFFIALFALATSILYYIQNKKQSQSLHFIYNLFSMILFLISVSALFTITNYVQIGFFILATLYFFINSLLIFCFKKSEKESQCKKE